MGDLEGGENMDLMTIVGLILGAAAVYFVMLHGGVVHLLFNLDALILVLGGTVACTLIAYPWSIIKHAPKALKLILFPPKNLQPEEVIKIVVGLAERARRNGIESLQNDIHTLNDKFLVNSVQMLIDGTEPDTVRDNLEKEIVCVRRRHQKVGSIFRTMGTFAPIFGLLGTLIGVVQVLKNITDPQSMGASMAIAITTTFYGIFGTNFIFLPAAVKLNEYSEEEILTKELVIEGVISIQAGDLPLMVSKKLESFLSARLREQALKKK